MHIEVRGAKREEVPAVCRLVNLAFGRELCAASTYAKNDPDNRPENTRVLLEDGRIVSAVLVVVRQAYVFGESVNFGWVGLVATHPNHRGRGYMRRVMNDAHEYMRRRGCSYAGLMGGWQYTGSLGWRQCGRKNSTLDWKYAVRARDAAASSLGVRLATNDDIPFLSRAYAALNGQRFGPVVRTPEYWRQWSLRRPWDGVYVVASRGDTPVGYFHVAGGDVDEIGWETRREDLPEAVFLSAASWSAAEGLAETCFFLGRGDDERTAALRGAFGDVPRTYVDPLGQAVRDGDRTPYLAENWPGGAGYQVKFLKGGPGVLAGLKNTDNLTDVMARYAWTFYDGDSM